jgi:hypothetical protein
MRGGSAQEALAGTAIERGTNRCHGRKEINSSHHAGQKSPWKSAKPLSNASPTMPAIARYTYRRANDPKTIVDSMRIAPNESATASFG